MIVLPQINPFVFTIAPGIGIRWYALMYILGFAIAWCLGSRRLCEVGLQRESFLDFISSVALGIIVGGRVGYVFIYQLDYLVLDPLLIFRLWHGGMAFHGALVGGVVALYVFSRQSSISFFRLVHFTVPLIPPGLMLGRLGNFINGELWGRVTNVPWAMVFPHSDLLPRHPSQLYEMLGEGVLLYVIIAMLRKKLDPESGHLGMWFLVHYAWIRFVIEFFREPDYNLGYVLLNTFSMGQVLCLLMFIIGGSLLLFEHIKIRLTTLSVTNG